MHKARLLNTWLGEEQDLEQDIIQALGGVMYKCPYFCHIVHQEDTDTACSVCTSINNEDIIHPCIQIL